MSRKKLNQILQRISILKPSEVLKKFKKLLQLYIALKKFPQNIDRILKDVDEI